MISTKNRQRTIDLSADMGEAAGPEQQAVEDALWPMLRSASVACGGHAGDVASMRHAVESAVRHRVVLAAHPSYPDRANFGRKMMSIDPSALTDSLVLQMRSLGEIARQQGLALTRVKAHGALYNDAHRDRKLADLLVEAILEIGDDLAIVAGDRSQMASAARASGLAVIREAFADRRYRPDGSLTPRSEPNALLSIDEAAGQALRLATAGRAIAGDDSEIEIPFDTICIHGDMPGAVERLRAIRGALTAAGLAV